MHESKPIPRLPVHDLGALHGLTRWINKHDEGLSELIKNVRAAYQENRANVEPEDRVAIILIKDSNDKDPANIGVLDVGGFTFEDAKNWSVWNNPDASSRGRIKQEENQGNGGKAYMYRLFEGPSFILGVENDKQNNVGFIGKRNSLERGIPRFPTTNKEVWQPGDVLNPNENEKDIEVENWKDNLINNLFSFFKTGWKDLPKEARKSLEKRESFTLVTCNKPINWSNGKSNAKQFIRQVVKHQQAQRAIQQVKFYVIYNGMPLFGEPLELEKIEPLQGKEFERPLEYDIPEILLAPNRNQVNTTKSSTGKHSKGKITLHTSKYSMESSYKTLKPRWVITYETDYEAVGQKSIPEIVPATPGSHFIYATVHLNALSPDSVDSGRKRPNDTLLVQAIDYFLAEKIKELAKKINDLQKQEIRESVLDEIKKENEFLNKLTNEFLPSDGGEDVGDTSGDEGGKKKRTRRPIEYGTKPHQIKVNSYSLKIAAGVNINLASVLYPIIRDINGKPVNAEILWETKERQIITMDKDGTCSALKKGECSIRLIVEGTKIFTPPITIEVLSIKDVLLSPKNLKLGVGHSKQIIAQITTDENKRYSDVLLEWKHDSPDQNIIRISPKGYIFGNKVGNVSVFAGTNSNEGKWSNNPVLIEIIPSDEKGKGGQGFPTLKITGKDIDPFTGKKREGDPEAPALWQEFHDEIRNIWWLNTQSKDAQFAYKQYESGNKQLWKLFHAKLRAEMIIQAHLQHEYTKKGEEERPALWSDHKAFYDRKYVELTQIMWEKLTKYVLGETETN